jgi:hypothetical protein
MPAGTRLDTHDPALRPWGATGSRFMRSSASRFESAAARYFCAPPSLSISSRAKDSAVGSVVPFLRNPLIN